MMLAGCNTTPIDDVTVDELPEANISQYNSYAVLEVDRNSDFGTITPASPTTLAAMRNSVRSSLNVKGYRETTPENADLLIEIRADSEQQLRNDVFAGARTIPVYDSNGNIIRVRSDRLGIYGSDRQIEQHITLIVDVVEQKTDRLLWRGHSSWQIYNQRTPPDAERLTRNISSMLFYFPHNNSLL